MELILQQEMSFSCHVVDAQHLAKHSHAHKGAFQDALCLPVLWVAPTRATDSVFVARVFLSIVP